jgi:hypothetical protein
MFPSRANPVGASRWFCDRLWHYLARSEVGEGHLSLAKLIVLTAGIVNNLTWALTISS